MPDPWISTPYNAKPTAAPNVSCDVDRYADSLRQAFGVDFTILEVVSGQVLHRGADPLKIDWSEQIELCREVALRGLPEFVIDEDPLVVLALPLPVDGGQLLALATFITADISSTEEIFAACERFKVVPRNVLFWAVDQAPWSTATLQRMGRLWQQGMTSEFLSESLQQENRQITEHLTATYEEISLLHRLTQKLKLSSSDQELGELVLSWLAEVLPIQGLALKFLPAEGKQTGPSLQKSYLTHGERVFSAEQFDHFVAQLVTGNLSEPIIFGAAVTQQPDWQFPAVREAVLVPLIEGGRNYGWLAALNHPEHGRFGTIEASLLSSVAAILAIHSCNIELYRQQSELLTGVVRALTSAIDAKDPYTSGHSDRVAQVAVCLARALGCDEETLKTVYLSGLLHDIGKIGIDDSVLRKPGKLTQAEYEHIKLHPELGFKILKDLPQLDQVLPVVLHHHEAWNGKGYPEGLVGDQIPLLARILAVADSFDAMLSDRPYRKGLSLEELEDVFRSGAGKQWDAQIVEAFMRARGEIHAIVRREANEPNHELCQWV